MSATARAIAAPIQSAELGEHVADVEVGGALGDAELLRNGKGAFFVHDHSTYKYVKGGKPVTEDSATEMTPDQAIEWIAANSAIVMNDEGLPLPPEA